MTILSQSSGTCLSINTFLFIRQRKYCKQVTSLTHITPNSASFCTFILPFMDKEAKSRLNSTESKPKMNEKEASEKWAFLFSHKFLKSLQYRKLQYPLWFDISSRYTSIYLDLLQFYNPKELQFWNNTHFQNQVK